MRKLTPKAILRSLALASLALPLSLMFPTNLVYINQAWALSQQDIQSLSSSWVVPLNTAKALINEGAVVLDVRGADLKEAAPLANAVSVEWPYFTKETAAQKGQLLDDEAELTKRIRALGVSNDVPVLVVGDSLKGWGEDGRIVWTLRTLGHKAVFFVDGGVVALVKEGDPGIKKPQAEGSFTIQRVADFEIKKEELKQSLGKTDVVILDTREPREFAGETPYGESRGGHVPGAKHIFYKDFLDKNGNVLSAGKIKEKLSALGVKDNSEVISYCTGGIRSGFVTAVLNNAGIKARNYAGSMWDWSSADAAEYPLEKSSN